VIKESEHRYTCLVYNDGPCDCGAEPHMTDDEIDAELLEKELAKE